MGRIQNYSLINCAVNPQCARERYFGYNPILKKKKVVVAGGGVAGMEAARVLAIRGHEPVIYEKSGKLGGALEEAGVPSFKEDDRALIRWYVHTLEQLKVEVHLNTGLTKEKLGAMDYDALIVSTGAVAKRFEAMQDAAEVYALGDCRQFKNVHQAVWDAYEVANHI